jgi:hypothetical protein
VSIAAAGAAYLVAGWLGSHAGPHPAVAICAAVCLLLVGLLAMSWPHAHVRRAVDHAYAPSSHAA